MTPIEKVKTVGPEEDASRALALIRELDVRQLPVVDGGKLLGLVRRQDILRWLQLQTDVDAKDGGKS